MLTTLCPDSLIRADHPIRRIRVVVDAVSASHKSFKSKTPPTDNDGDSGPSADPPAGRNVEVG